MITMELPYRISLQLGVQLIAEYVVTSMSPISSWNVRDTSIRTMVDIKTVNKSVKCRERVSKTTKRQLEKEIATTPAPKTRAEYNRASIENRKVILTKF